jgi:hypothetical protein
VEARSGGQIAPETGRPETGDLLGQRIEVGVEETCCPSEWKLLVFEQEAKCK